jgi:hypothetical protein
MNTKSKTLLSAVAAAAVLTIAGPASSPASAATVYARHHGEYSAPAYRAPENNWYGNPDREWHGPNSQMNS